MFGGFQTKLFKKIISVVLFLAFLWPIFFVQADPDPAEERAALEQELRELEEQIAKYQEDITKTEQEKKTLQDQIYLLKQKVERLNLQIYQSNIMIKDLGFQVEDTRGSIDSTALKIRDSRKDLANILQLIYQEDQRSLLEIFLSEAELSDFFDDLVALESLSSKNQELLSDIKDLKIYLEDQKVALDNEKEDLEGVVRIITLQKQQEESMKQDKDYYLQLTEAEYQEQLAKKKVVEEKATEIRARIFELIGVPDAPTFGEAYELAKYAEGLTGIRPALLLAVLSQESNIGKNVGQCYLKNPDTGAGVVIYNGKVVNSVMKPSRDVGPFLEITRELGRDPYFTSVSCPMSIGYGGAMGPAQFIPSTWMIYRDEVRELIGKAADPWQIKDAFLAASLYLTDYGAASQTYNLEWKAAMIYFSGTSLRTRYNGYGFYGDSVMAIAAKYQADIEAID